MSLDVLLNRGKNKSLNCTLNYFAQQDKIFIMDNHLAAIWCWEKLDKNKKYNLLHIDAHYDLGAVPLNHKFYHSLDLTCQPVEKLMDYKVKGIRFFDNIPFFLWDNYIHLFIDKYPEVVDKIYMITQKVGGLNSPFKKKNKIIETDFWLLDGLYYSFQNDNWILNIDIDYFFDQRNNKQQIFSDDFIIFFSKWLNNNYENFNQILFAISPECCGNGNIGWDKSLRVLNLILKPLNIEVEIS